MFLLGKICVRTRGCFPRIRGDVPGIFDWCFTNRGFSPHTRGCSDRRIPRFLRAQVFPAYAGMFLSSFWLKSLRVCFPRIRGDVPATWRQKPSAPTFSPHTRGCSGNHVCGEPGSAVFPAYAGMFLSRPQQLHDLQRFPRIRGDVPPPKTSPLWSMRFSPHTRGCSVSPIVPAKPATVFPAYAGMFR